MKLLDRYLFRQFAGTFVLLLLGIPMLFIIGDLTDNIDRYLERGLGFQRVGLGYLFQLPLFIQYAFPIAALVATVFTVGGMTRHQEITAAKAGGVSFYRLLLPLLALGVLLSAAAAGLGELAPVTLERRAELMGERRAATSGPRLNFVYQTEAEGLLTARRLDPAAGQMSGLVLERNATEREPGMHRSADVAVWTEQGGWLLRQGWIRTIHADGRETTTRFDTLRIPAFTETPEELMGDPKDPELMRYSEMSRFITAIERSGGDSRPLRVERAQKLAIPVAVVIIMLFGAPLVTSSARGGAAYGVGISLATTILYMLMFRVGRALGASGAVDPIIAAWAPNVIFLVAGFVLLSRVRT